jgi:quercetin dioxygenase-like cupin family protein
MPYICPPGHRGFKDRQLIVDMGADVIDCKIAHIEPRGGGPSPNHTHEHDHVFIVLDGCATIKVGDQNKLVAKEEAIRINGDIPHSVWNETDEPVRVMGIDVKRAKT